MECTVDTCVSDDALSGTFVGMHDPPLSRPGTLTPKIKQTMERTLDPRHITQALRVTAAAAGSLVGGRGKLLRDGGDGGAAARARRAQPCGWAARRLQDCNKNPSGAEWRCIAVWCELLARILYSHTSLSLHHSTVHSKLSRHVTTVHRITTISVASTIKIVSGSPSTCSLVVW